MSLAVMLSVSLLCVCGCKTRSLSNLQPIPVLEGITEAEALDAVVAASSTEPDRVKTRGPIKSYEDGLWTVQDKDAKSVLVSYAIDRRSVTVRYTLEDRLLVPFVESGINVSKGSSRIHGNALVWINRHASDIKAAMWKIKSGKKPE